MPELPDIAVYLEALGTRVLGQPLVLAKTLHPFVLRTAEPPLGAVNGRRVGALRRVGKRVVLEFDGELFLVFHLGIAGRLKWREPGRKAPPARGLLAAFEFPAGSLYLTEAGTRRWAQVHLLHGEAALQAVDPGGLDVLRATAAEFTVRLRSGNHTLKRALTDPRLFSGIGNAYSDEILHRARLSPLKLSSRLSEDEAARLHSAVLEVIHEWTDRLRQKAGGGFPEKVTAFHEEMAVHGRFGRPCPVCGAPVQRIVYAESEANYCARCQTGGKVLADRALSRLLKGDWPRSIDDLE